MVRRTYSRVLILPDGRIGSSVSGPQGGSWFHAKGGGGSSTQTTEPWDGQKPYLLDVYGKAQDWYNSAPGAYEGPTYAAMTPQQRAALSGMTGAADMQGQVGGATTQSFFDTLQNSDAYREMVGSGIFGAINTAAGQAGQTQQSATPQIALGERVSPNAALEQMLSGRMNPHVGEAISATNRQTTSAFDDMARSYTNRFEDTASGLFDEYRGKVMGNASDALANGQMGNTKKIVYDAIAGGDFGTALGQARERLGSELLSTQRALTEQIGTNTANMNMRGYETMEQMRSQAAQMATQAMLSGDRAAIQQAELEMQRMGFDESTRRAMMGEALQAANLGTGFLGNMMNTDLRSMALAPQIMGMQTMPWQTRFSAGETIRGDTQNQYDDAMSRYYRESQLPLQNLQNYLGLVGGGGYNTMSTTTPGNSTGQNLLGGAMTGMGMYSMMNPGVAMSLGAVAPWALGGAALGSLLF